MMQPLTPEFMLAFYLPDGTDISRYKQVDAKFTPDESLTPYVGSIEITIEEQNIVPPRYPARNQSGIQMILRTGKAL